MRDANMYGHRSMYKWQVLWLPFGGNVDILLAVLWDSTGAWRWGFGNLCFGFVGRSR